jgi:tungstate transport system ATP-binding protein
MSGVLASLRGASKSFGKRVILDSASLELEAGRAYVLTGENGSGKSTLLRVLSGLEPAQGMLRFGAMEIALSAYPARLRREIIYVHQHPYLFHTSLLQNIAFGLKARGEPAGSRKAKAEAAIAWARLQAVASTPPHKLSGGERQRAALARARVLAPQLLLLDEPTSNLDSASRAQVVELVAALCSEGKTTVLMACHDRELIELPGVVRLRIAEGRISSV